MPIPWTRRLIFLVGFVSEFFSDLDVCGVDSIQGNYQFCYPELCVLSE